MHETINKSCGLDVTPNNFPYIFTYRISKTHLLRTSDTL